MRDWNNLAVTFARQASDPRRLHRVAHGALFLQRHQRRRLQGLSGEIHALGPGCWRASSCACAACSLSTSTSFAEGEDGARTVFKKIKPKSLQIFSRQFATMIDAGLTVVSALVVLEEQTDDKYLSAIISELRADVEGGLLLSQAMARHPKIFSRLYVAMVEAGEAAGILDQVLDRVAFQIEKETQIKRRVKGAMIYPTMV